MRELFTHIFRPACLQGTAGQMRMIKVWARVRLSVVLVWGASLLAPAFVSGALAQMPLANSDAPIDISADSLEVKQEQNVAIWTGAVRVVQGGMILESDRLDVHYATQNKGTEDDSVIRQINAFGNVQITSPEEKAKGDKGIYDMAGGTVTLQGNVVLTRGENILRGAQLVIDLATGRSTLTSGVPGVTTTGGRVSGTFKGSGKQ